MRVAGIPLGVGGVGVVASGFINLTPSYAEILEDGKLLTVKYATTGEGFARINSAKATGKHYLELEVGAIGLNLVFGVQSAGSTNISTFWGGAGNSSDRYGYSVGTYASGHEKTNNDTFTDFGINWCSAGYCVGMAYDADAGSVTFYTRTLKTNVLTLQGTAFTGIPSGLEPFAGFDSYGGRNAKLRIITPMDLPYGFSEWNI